MENVSITRRNVIDLPPNLSQFSIHFHPFNTLPRFESHLHPKFVIFDAGKKLSKLAVTSQSVYGLFCDRYPIAEKIEVLYIAWTRDVPPIANKDPSYWVPDDGFCVTKDEVGEVNGEVDGDDGDDSNYSDYGDNKTMSGRGKAWITQERRQAPDKWQAPPAKRQREVLSRSFSHNQHLLSEVTLSSFNQQFRKAAWTDDRIREWSKKAFGKRKIDFV